MRKFAYDVWIGRLAVLVLFLLVWHFGAQLDFADPLIRRTPLQVWNAFIDLAVSGRLWVDLWSTISATLVAFVLGSLVGILAGAILGIFPRLSAWLDPYIDALNSMPRIAFAPIFIIAFGIGQEAKIALAFTLVVFLLLMNTRAGIKNADEDIVRMAHSLGLSKAAMLSKVYLPGAVPSVFAGLRIGLTYSLLGVVTSEMISSRAGLGQIIQADSALFKLESVYAVVIVLAIVATILNSVAAMLERHLLKWQIV